MAAHPVTQALSLWNCTRVGSVFYLTIDLSLLCEGDEYRRMTAFNVAFVVGVVVGWPAFIVWYLRRVQLQGRTAVDSVLNRVGFLFEQYRPEYLYWDVVETVRKLYLVTVVAFFESGSMLQLVLSVIVSSMAFAYHVYALPYRQSWLNMMQGACLFFIWLTLQAGLLVQNTQPDRNTGDPILVALSVANIVVFVSPVLIGLLAALQVLPESVRRSASSFFVRKSGEAADKSADAQEQPDDERGDVEEWENNVLPPLVFANHNGGTNVEAAHIELAALSGDALQSADLDAWQGNTMFGPGPAASTVTTDTFSPPSADNSALRVPPHGPSPV